MFYFASKNKFDKTLIQYNKKDIAYGHKVMHKSSNLSLPIEFCIYDNKYKSIVLHENTSKIELPIYVSISLIILKYLLKAIDLWIGSYDHMPSLSICVCIKITIEMAL